tara:strand:- start:388 stop:2346 length:1959 start_codon:yes stop_codon:yes gene_type:complete
MKTSKFVQLDPKVLMEYIYEDSFLTSENYIVTHDLNQDQRSFAPKNDEGSNNRYANQLVLIDPVKNKYGIRNSDQYNFLQDREYNQNLPLKYDRVKLHFPIDFNFADYVGCYLRVYAMDYENNDLIGMTNYYFDKQDQDRFNSELQLSSPPNTLNGRLWGKYIEIAYPSPNTISLQRTNNIANSNSINYNISGGVGLSNTSPIMIEFGYITKKEEINNVITYLLRAPYQTSVPQTPDYENLSITIEANSNGDWFDIYGTFNGTSAEFNTWVQVSQKSGKRYYVEYVITMFEENIKGKTLTTLITSDFNEKIEYRPIIKYSSTTAAIEVVMRIIDQVDSSIITRRASYGLLPDEISKYSRSLVRINVDGIKTPKIYNLRSGGSMFDAINGLNNRKYTDSSSEIYGNSIQTVKVPYPILTNSNSILAKSKSAVVSGTIWYGFGKLKITVDPFDNIFKFTLAKSIKRTTHPSNTGSNTTPTTPSLSEVAPKKTQVSASRFALNVSQPTNQTNQTGGNTYTTTHVNHFDLVNAGTIDLYFKNHNRDIKTSLYRKTGEIDLKNGTVVFKLDKNKVNDVRQIYDSGVNMFYITSTNEETIETTVIYEGTFIMSDSVDYVEEMSTAFELDTNESEDGGSVEIVKDGTKETAIVTRKSSN